MVLGLRTKNRNNATAHIEFIVHVEEIKPWPTSIKTLILKWINGDQKNGSYYIDVEDSEVEIHESFKLLTTLQRDEKSRNEDKYLNNFLEFALYEPSKDSAAKSKLLGSTAINLADYAFIDEPVGIRCPLHFQTSSGSNVQPVLHVKLQPVVSAAADNSGSFSRTSVSKDACFDKDIMSSEDEISIDSFSDEEDISSSSSKMTLPASDASLRSGQRLEKSLPDLLKESLKQSNRGSEDDKEQHINGHSDTQFPKDKLQPPSIVPPRFNRGNSSIHRTTPSQILKHTKSVHGLFNSAWNAASAGASQVSERSSKPPAPSSNTEYESQINMLEEELKEAAAVEIGLYSVVAEHGSSISKVHAPARRLSRFYIHTWKNGSASQRASAARAIMSGFILVSKACGNDVARLTFWLSNTIVLRASLCQHVLGPASNGKARKKNDSWAWLPSSKPSANADDWEDPKAFNYALEKFEAWIFIRIVESVWWQSFTPNMQSAAAKSANSRKSAIMKHGLGDQAQGNFSIELWKKAFKDAWERLCPTRVGGHECGCLPLIAKKVMEQLVARLDVAILNAILRESADEMPTDPISDPISDSKVLPIPAGKTSFGAGAQLKNAIGSWSRWLSDLFDIDDIQPSGDDASKPDMHQSSENEKPSKTFRLLNELSDLMMLPAEMLSEKSTRKEVCPTFTVPLIKIALCNFVPDEFNPNPLPENIFEKLDSEDCLDSGYADTLTSFPVGAVPVFYMPPPPSAIAKFVGDLDCKNTSKSKSTVLKKSYTSDDELEELDSPAMASIMGDTLMPRSEGGRKVLRYRLLREIWNERK